MGLRGCNCCWIVFLLFLAGSCASYYQINSEFNHYFEQGSIEAAGNVLDANKKAGRKKARFIYYANQGIINSMLGNLEESNEWLEKAYIFGEDYQKNAADVVASFLVNPNTITYPGEDHEHLLLLYYKAINFLKMGQYESALIECRRLNNRLNELSDKYRSESKYRRDAFIHNLMGIIHEAVGDYNNAFIAYRNAYNIYEEDYQRLFKLDAPRQLKVDLIRSAALTGFGDQVDFYEKKFDMKYEPRTSAGELVFFWQNGLGPVKDEWSINFTVIDSGTGFVTFANDEYNMSFPFAVDSDEEKASLTDLRLFRVAFPKYVERPPMVDRASLSINGQHFSLEKAEPINDIAFKVLQERMIEELGKGLLRAAVKKTIEMGIRGESKQDDEEKKSKEEKQEEAMREGLSLLVGVLNAVTEKADTRNWQTLPHSIYYSRLPLEEGRNKVVLETSGSTGKTGEKELFTFNISQGETVFHTYQTLGVVR